MNFAELMKHQRGRLHITQEELANRVGFTRVTITRYENRNLEPKLRTALKIATVLKFSLDELKEEVKL